MANKLSQEDFIIKCKDVHGEKYDYSKLEYVNYKTKVKIICLVHGVFEISPKHFLRGHGCKKCSDEKPKYNTLTTSDFIKRSKEIHGDMYDYSLSVYTGIHKNIKIVCKEHGIFEQLPNNHFKKLGCPKCSNIKRLTIKEFIEKSIDIHGDKYDYSLVDYKNNRKKVKIICKIHGVFDQAPTSHMRNAGCPKCKRSIGEENIEKFLINNKINHISQKTFIGCVNKLNLHFDFYLPDYNTCIEFDGKQHFMIVEKFGGEKEFISRQINDNIKTDYCKENNIKLYRIKYNEKLNDKLNLIYNDIKNNYTYVKII